MLSAIFLSATLAAPVHAGQPISESLVECSVIYGIVLSIKSDRSDARAAQLAQACGAYHDAAVRTALAEGHGDASAHIERLRAAKVEKWGAYSPIGLALSQEYRDWAGYCRALGEHKGISPF